MTDNRSFTAQDVLDQFWIDGGDIIKAYHDKYGNYKEKAVTDQQSVRVSIGTNIHVENPKIKMSELRYILETGELPIGGNLMKLSTGSFVKVDEPRMQNVLAHKHNPGVDFKEKHRIRKYHVRWTTPTSSRDDNSKTFLTLEEAHTHIMDMAVTHWKEPMTEVSPQLWLDYKAALVQNQGKCNN